MHVVYISQRESGLGTLALGHLRNQRISVRKVLLRPGVIVRLERLQPPLAIIDATMSAEHAIELCVQIRSSHTLARTPVMLLAVNTSEEARILGLESGADDYITESCTGMEVVARVRAVLHRVAQQEVRLGITPRTLSALGSSLECSPPIKTGDIEIDPKAMRISVRGSEIAISNLEFRLLYYLAHNQRRVFTRDKLLDAVWGTRYAERRSVDACVRRIRHKLEIDPSHPAYLKTVRGAGYCLQPAKA